MLTSASGPHDQGRTYGCVIGEIDLLRSLGLARIPCAVVAPRGDFTRFSRFAKVRIDLIDDFRYPQDLVERLIAWGADQAHKPVLFYDGDWDLIMVSRFRERLREAFTFVVPEAELVLDLVDKSRFTRLARTHELPVPATVAIAPGDDSTDLGLRYPVVIKPLTRLHATWKPLSTGKVIQVDSAEELARMLPRLAERGIEALAQELVPGPEHLIESYHAYVDASGAVVCEFTGVKIRTHPTRHGYSTALQLSDAADIRALGRDILERIDLRGVAKLDFKRHPETGTPMLLEINPRFSLWHHLGAKAGVNIPEAVFRDLTGAPRAAPRTARPGVRWCNFRSDVFAARDEGLSFWRWLPWALTCEAKHAMAWDDPLPMIGGTLHRLTNRLRRVRPVGID